MLHQIKALQFDTDLGFQKHCRILLQMVIFKDFSRPLSFSQVLFKANLIFKDFSRQSVYSSTFKPVPTLEKIKNCVFFLGDISF